MFPLGCTDVTFHKLIFKNKFILNVTVNLFSLCMFLIGVLHFFRQAIFSLERIPDLLLFATCVAIFLVILGKRIEMNV